MNCNFSFVHYREIFEKALENNYQIITCKDFFDDNYDKDKKVLINRVDVDLSLKQAKKVLKIFNDLKIKATFFIRMHASEYNPFSFENYMIIRDMINSENEIGYHSEIIDCFKIWGISPKTCLLKDVVILERMFDIIINGVASHRGPTGFNNLDFWKNNRPEDFNLFSLYYEAYDPELFNTFYVSDALIHGWKCYRNGILETNNNLCLCEHIKNNEKIIYSLTHPIKYYERHMYENEY